MGLKSLLKAGQKIFLKKKSNKTIIVALPSPYLSNFKESNFNLAGQNVSNQSSGAFTSQLSAQMLKDCGAEYCLIGHSEARQYLMETNDNIKQKFDQLAQESIQPSIMYWRTT